MINSKKIVKVFIAIETEDEEKKRAAYIDFTSELRGNKLTAKFVRKRMEQVAIMVAITLQKMRLAKPYKNEEGDCIDEEGNLIPKEEMEKNIDDYTW